MKSLSAFIGLVVCLSWLVVWLWAITPGPRFVACLAPGVYCHVKR